MTTSDRGVHPDLVGEELDPALSPTPPPTRGRRSKQSPSEGAVPPASADAGQDASSPPQEPEPADATQGAESEAPTPPPEWLEQVRTADDPQAMLATLLKNVPIDELEKNPTIAGWLGDMGNKRARAIIAKADADRAEQAKRDAIAKGDLYALGQLAAPEVQQRALADYQQSQVSPFMQGVEAFQRTLPPEVQQAVSGRSWPGSPAEGVSAYLGAIVEAAISHRLNDAVEGEIKKREPALRKAFLSGTNGSAQVPELDGGPAQSVREITDDQIAAMSLREYDAMFDEDGRPKAGVRVRLTRAIPLNRR